MALKLKTGPATAPITLAEAKAQCRVDHDDEDAFIASLIEAATSYLDCHTGVLGCALVSQQWELYYDAFPCGDLQIPLGPLVSVESVEYADPVTGNYLSWSKPGNWTFDAVSDPGWLIPVGSWPTAQATANAVKVTFTAGFGDASKVPAAIKAALKMLVAEWYENREASTDKNFEEQNAAFKSLLAPFRRYMI